MPPLPRLRIAHQLSLLIAAAVVLAVLVVGGLSIYNLRSGFKDYLKARDDEQLMRLVALIEQHATTDPELQWLRNNPDPMRALMDEFNGRATRAPQNGRPPRPPGQDGGRPPHPPPPQEAAQPPPPRESLGSRLVIRDLQGQRLAGRPQPPEAPTTRRAVKVRGEEVAFVELAAAPELDGVDAGFIRHQTSNLIWAALVSTGMALFAAWWMAGRWSRPLLALQRASQSIARGQRVQRLQPSGAREIAQLMEDINAMTAELTRLEDARRHWIAQISHELRTPLSVLRGELESIEDGARLPTPQVLGGLRDEVLQLSRLVDDLHTLSVADMHGLPCEFTGGDAHAGLWRAANRFGVLAKQKGLLLQLPPQSAVALPVLWDFGRIEQLVNNLLTNSLRYTDTPGTVVVAWTVEGAFITLTVDDSAPGVSTADLSELFEPLFRVDRARQRGDGHASGLGLSIVRSIAQAHQGSASASASPLGGVQLRVRLAVHPQSVDKRGRT
jgi:two-component system sensor histidine kinase BaeS